MGGTPESGHGTRIWARTGATGAEVPRGQGGCQSVPRLRLALAYPWCLARAVASGAQPE